MSEPVLRAVELEKRYSPSWLQTVGSGRAVEVEAVRGVSLEIRAGEILALVGESGCGKSTTGRLLLGLERPSGGKVLFHGRDLQSFDRRDWTGFRKRVQVVFQDPYSSLNPRLTVGGMLREALLFHGLARHGDVSERVDALLVLVGLDPTAGGRFPHEFSGGQRQRIGIARALAVEPEVIIADEPVSALDVSVQAQVLNLLADLRQQLGLALLFIAHDLAVVRHIADRTAVMFEGRIVETAPAERLFSEPAHSYTRELLASIPRLPATSP